MEATANETIVIDESRKAVVAELMRNVYLWMTGGLAVTGVIAWLVAGSPTLIQFFFGSKVMFWGLMIAELVLVFVLNIRIQKFTFATASFLFLLYCALNGVLLSVIFVIYELESIGEVFFATAGMFAVLATIGTYTKKDLSRLGTFLIMALAGLIIASAVGIVMGRPENIWITIIGVLIFAGLTVYDAQKIRMLMLNEETVNEGNMKLALLGALSLYLDFINLLLKLLSLLGKKRR